MIEAFYPLLAAVLFFSVLITMVKVLARGLMDVLTLTALTFALFYGLRIVLLVLGLDTPFPGKFFAGSDAAAVITTTILWLTLYLVAFAVAAAVVLNTGRGGPGPFAAQIPNFRRMIIATVVLTAVGAGISVVMLGIYGGIGGFITAAKVSKALAGLYVLKIPSATGAIVAAATFLDARQRRNHQVAVMALLCAVLNGLCVFLWGQRSTLVVVGAMVVIGSVLVAARAGGSGGRRVGVASALLRVALAVLIVVGISYGLRVARDTATRGELESVVADATPARQISLATNAVYFDAAALGFRDWPAKYEYRDGEDFYVGIVGVIPRAIWDDKPTAIYPGQWFRQVYQPNKVNGWPVGPPALWYLNFGGLGLLLGALLSGAAVGWLSKSQRVAAECGLNLGMALVAAIYVLQLGISSETFLRAAIWIVPLWLVKRYVAPRRKETAGAEHKARAFAHRPVS